MSYDSDGYKMCMIAKLLGKKGKMTKQVFFLNYFKSSRNYGSLTFNYIQKSELFFCIKKLSLCVYYLDQD